jgi:alcohol dehydrogenase
LRDVGVSEDQLDELARRSVAADYTGDTTEPDFRTLFGAAF